MKLNVENIPTTVKPFKLEGTQSVANPDGSVSTMHKIILPVLIGHTQDEAGLDDEQRKDHRKFLDSVDPFAWQFSQAVAARVEDQGKAGARSIKIHRPIVDLHMTIENSKGEAMASTVRCKGKPDIVIAEDGAVHLSAKFAARVTSTELAALSSCIGADCTVNLSDPQGDLFPEDLPSPVGAAVQKLKDAQGDYGIKSVSVGGVVVPMPRSTKPAKTEGGPKKKAARRGPKATATKKSRR